MSSLGFSEVLIGELFKETSSIFLLSYVCITVFTSNLCLEAAEDNNTSFQMCSILNVCWSTLATPRSTTSMFSLWALWLEGKDYDRMGWELNESAGHCLLYNGVHGVPYSTSVLRAIWRIPWAVCTILDHIGLPIQLWIPERDCKPMMSTTLQLGMERDCVFQSEQLCRSMDVDAYITRYS